MIKVKSETVPSAEKAKAREVLFVELENVAINGRELMFDVLKQVMKRSDIDVTPALFARCGLAPRPQAAIEAMLADAGKSSASAASLAAEAETLAAQAFAEKSVFNKDLPALVQAAREKNIQTVVLSAWPESVASALMKKTGLDAMGVELVAMDSHDPVFPRADHWLRILKHRNQEAIPLITVVSSRAACKGALTAGASCIVVPDAHTAFEDFSGARAVLESLGDMPPAELIALVSRP